MAIDVNKVYRVVLSILNKEQRGYLTPDQFNRLGRQAQLDLFEKSFYDYNRQLTKRNIQGVNSEYGDIADKIEEKIDLFAESQEVLLNGNSFATSDLDHELYKVVQLTKDDGITEIEKVKKSEYTYMAASKLTEPSENYPVYIYDKGEFKIIPNTINNCVIDYIRKPEDPIWNYTVGEGSSYTYTTTGSQDFELHPSDETDLVIKILALAGVVIKDPSVVQVAQQQEVNNVNQENS